MEPVVTSAEMQACDRFAIEKLKIPSLALMENAGRGLVEMTLRHFGSLKEKHILVFCGKGNNGGDGFVVGRQIHTRFRPRSLDVVLAGEPEGLRGDAAENFRMLRVCGCPVAMEITPGMREAWPRVRGRTLLSFSCMTSACFWSKVASSKPTWTRRQKSSRWDRQPDSSSRWSTVVWSWRCWS